MTQAGEFTDFVRAYTPALVRTAYLLTGSRNAAEELVQDTLVRLYPKWDKVTGADVPLAYVRRSLSNNFVNDRRRAYVRHELTTEQLPDAAVEPAAIHRTDDRSQLWPLLNRLPDRQRAAIVLRYYEDLDDDEIAAILDCRPGTVRSLLSRGLATLRALDGAADDVHGLRNGRTA